MRHILDDRDKEIMGVQHYPDCPYCGRLMRKANVGTVEREQKLLVCCDPRCRGREREPDGGQRA